MMGLQFGLTARFRFVTARWGEDVVYRLHRQISLLAVALVVAHPLILLAVRLELVALLNSFAAPWRARFAALSTYSLIALVAMALWRGGRNIRSLCVARIFHLRTERNDRRDRAGAE
jgi:predicted ferric reductase